jgi:curved DNA-binding protein CbpA
MSQLFDPYKVLGISPAASAAEVKAAFRRKCKQCHPDMGGTHQQMIEVLEAWEVLSSPTTRMEYDRTQASPEEASIKVRWDSVAEELKSKVQHYPKTWSQFERWMNSVTDDAATAKYGVKRVLNGRVLLPDVSGSTTGTLLVTAGAFIGLLLGISASDGAFSVKSFLTSATSAWVGAWFGCGMNWLIGGAKKTEGRTEMSKRLAKLRVTIHDELQQRPWMAAVLPVLAMILVAYLTFVGCSTNWTAARSADPPLSRRPATVTQVYGSISEEP